MLTGRMWVIIHTFFPLLSSLANPSLRLSYPIGAHNNRLLERTTCFNLERVIVKQMLKDWDFAQFFPNWNATSASETSVAMGARPARSSESPMEEKSTSSSSSSGGVGSVPSQIKTHRRNESDSALASVIKANNNGPNPDPLFSSRLMWTGRQRSVREPTLANDDRVSLTEFSRKASQLELRSKASSPSEFAPPRREKTDILDLRRLELKRELEERRRANGPDGTGRHSQSEVRGSSMIMSSIKRPTRPPLMKSTSEPCATLTLFTDHQQVRRV